MHHINHIRLLDHPDPRMRAAAANASRLRSEFWRALLRRCFSGMTTTATERDTCTQPTGSC